MSTEIDGELLSEIYSHRFAPNQATRTVLWSTLVRHFFQAYIRPEDTVLDLAAGYCDFVNHVSAKRRIAVDMNPDVKDRASDGVEVYLTRSDALPAELTGQIDVVFVSNFFEHLPNTGALLATLAEIRRVLKPDGRLLILQPNLRVLGAAYWDFLDHTLGITDKSLDEALRISRFETVQTIRRFLPYTAQSRFPVTAFFVRSYLRVKPAWRLLGKQMFVVATPRR